MKIIKLPFETKIKCNCGCEFEFDTNDIFITEFCSFGSVSKDLFVHCPICKKPHTLKQVKSND